MKAFSFLLVATLLVATSCNVRNNNATVVDEKIGTTQPTENMAPTTVQLLDSVYDFGKIKDGQIVEFSYRFKNTGDKPLVITNAIASCGCTVPEKPEQPILPGEIGFIKVKFNSENRVGQTHKTVTVTANVDPQFPELLLTGEVTAKK